jgi:hypothetical protein
MGVPPFQTQSDVLRAAAAVRQHVVQPNINPVSPQAVDNRDALAAGRGTVMDRPVLVADLWTAVAAVQIGAAAVMIGAEDPGSVLIGMSPLLRSVLEHSAATVWVLDNQVGPEIRAARAALYHLRGLEDSTKAASHLGGHGNKSHAEARAQLRALRKVLVKQFPNGTDLTVSPPVIAGERSPSPTGPVLHYGERWGIDKEWEGIYDYLSAAANHPNMLTFELLGDADGLIDRFCLAMISPYVKALQHFADYCGFPRAELDQFVDLVRATWPDAHATASLTSTLASIIRAISA